MYHCTVKIYLLGKQRDLFDILKEMAPLERFKHEFSESEEFDRDLASEADIVFAETEEFIKHADPQILFSSLKKDAELILITETAQTDIFTKWNLSGVTDIWKLPMEKEEVKFRFLQWQKNNKLRKDFWQSQNYLDSTINSIPHLIWYKDKDGVHEKVNVSFSKAVNKTMEQIEGRGHYYIWDITPDEYAKGEFICMESEYEVMNKRQTCIFDETVKIKDEMRQLKTYKSPLFDLDGSVMGTVGVATDVTQERLYEQMIVNNANTDFLTGLYNRRYVSQFIEEREDEPLTIYYLDLDNFKTVNDQYGHLEGDNALLITAETLRKCMPDGMVSRIGGDEFLVVELGAFTEQEIEEKRNWLQKQLDDAYRKNVHFKNISASIGTAHSENGKSVMDMMIKEADEFMYREKNKKKQSAKTNRPS